MRFVSLFSGIGGFDLGLERAGWTAVAQSEIDPFCQRILAHHWPHVPQLGDVQRITTLPPHECIVGGFPCQDLSVAGKGAGITASRSGLWREYARLISTHTPRWVIIENVYRGWKRWVPFVRGDLHSRGYASLPIRLRASDFGAPHERARCFVLATPYAPRPATNVDGLWQRKPQGLESHIGRWPVHSAGAWAIEPTVDRVVHGLPRDLARWRKASEKALGNAIVPQIAEWLGHRINEIEGLDA